MANLGVYQVGNFWAIFHKIRTDICDSARKLVSFYTIIHSGERKFGEKNPLRPFFGWANMGSQQAYSARVDWPACGRIGAARLGRVGTKRLHGRVTNVKRGALLGPGAHWVRAAMRGLSVGRVQPTTRSLCAGLALGCWPSVQSDSPYSSPFLFLFFN